MSKISLAPNASGTGNFTIASPNGNTDRVLTLPDATGTINTSGTVNEVPAGTASAPSIYPTGDTNTGIFFPAADTIAFTEGGVEGMRINSSGYITNAVNGLGNGLVQAQQYYRLNSTVAGSNATGAQSMFGVGVTLVGSTVYEFEMIVPLSKSAGATSHTVSVLFGGTATINNIIYTAITNISAAIVAGVAASNITIQFNNAASAFAVTPAIATAVVYFTCLIKGTVSVNAGGTFIPQYSLSAAPGGAYTTQIGSYIKIAPLSASGANTSVGTWA